MFVVIANVVIECERFLLNVIVYSFVMQVMATVRRCRAVLVPDSGTYTAVLVPASHSLNFCYSFYALLLIGVTDLLCIIKTA